MADPGFCSGVGRELPKRDYFANFLPKTARGGASVPGTPLDPPMPNNHICSKQWLTLIPNSSRILERAPGTCAPSRYNLFHFHAIFGKKLYQTRMYSSRMRTGRNISHLLLFPGGVCSWSLRGGLSASDAGVCSWSGVGGSISQHAMEQTPSCEENS